MVKNDYWYLSDILTKYPYLSKYNVVCIHEVISKQLFMPPAIVAARIAELDSSVATNASRRVHRSFITTEKGGQGTGNVASLNRWNTSAVASAACFDIQRIEYVWRKRRPGLPLDGHAGSRRANHEPGLRSLVSVGRYLCTRDKRDIDYRNR